MTDKPKEPGGGILSHLGVEPVTIQIVPGPAPRKRLPHRRRSETIEFERNGSRYFMTVGFFEDDTVGEVFINSDRANSELDAFISDAAILVSLALQHGASLLELAHALKRDARGVASSPIGAALDRIAKPTAVRS